MNYFKLFNSVKIVSGFNRALIYDTQSDIVSLIPKDLFELLYENSGFNLSKLRKENSSKNRIVINEYLNFLISNKLGFYCNDIKEYNNFLNLNDEVFDVPFDLSYLLIDLSYNNYFDSKLINQIIENKISFIQIRFCEKINLTKLQSILKLCDSLNDSFVEEISFVLEFDDDIYNYIKEDRIVINKYLNFVFHSCDDKLKDEETKNLSIAFINYRLVFPFSCGLVKKSNFVYNENFYRESKSKNSCLNRKISIDKEGKIKNCPSMLESYGEIDKTTFAEVLSNQDFKKYWNINKEQIEVCKDCEFRHICTDCRAYVEDPYNKFSKPLKCGYDPYKNVWEDWSTNPLKQKTIKHYGFEILNIS